MSVTTMLNNNLIVFLSVFYIIINVIVGQYSWTYITCNITIHITTILQWGRAWILPEYCANIKIIAKINYNDIMMTNHSRITVIFNIARN